MTGLSPLAQMGLPQNFAPYSQTYHQPCCPNFIKNASSASMQHSAPMAGAPNPPVCRQPLHSIYHDAVKVCQQEVIARLAAAFNDDKVAYAEMGRHDVSVVYTPQQIADAQDVERSATRKVLADNNLQQHEAALFAADPSGDPLINSGVHAVVQACIVLDMPSAFSHEHQARKVNACLEAYLTAAKGKFTAKASSAEWKQYDNLVKATAKLSEAIGKEAMLRDAMVQVAPAIVAKVQAENPGVCASRVFTDLAKYGNDQALYQLAGKIQRGDPVDLLAEIYKIPHYFDAEPGAAQAAAPTPTPMPAPQQIMNPYGLPWPSNHQSIGNITIDNRAFADLFREKLAKGDQGEKAEDGAQGLKGKDGAQGARGDDGLPVPIGEVGPQGPMGPAGPRGDGEPNKVRKLTKPSTVQEDASNVPGGSVGLTIQLQPKHLDQSRLKKTGLNHEAAGVHRRPSGNNVKATPTNPLEMKRVPDPATSGPSSGNARKNNHSPIATDGGLRRPKNAVSESGYTMAISTGSRSTPTQVQGGTGSRPERHDPGAFEASRIPARLRSPMNAVDAGLGTTGSSSKVAGRTL